MKKVFFLSALILIVCALNVRSVRHVIFDSHVGTMRIDSSKVSKVLYKCGNNKIICVVYDNRDDQHQTATIRLNMRKARTIKMKRVLAASGIRYTDGKLVWWSKGKTGFLSEASGKEKILINNCREYKIVK